MVVDHYAARAALWATFAVGVAAEFAVAVRRGGTKRAAAPPRDRGTKQVLALALVAGLVVGAWLAHTFEPLRAGADTWATYALGLGVLWLGVGLRLWAVWSLGRYFRREVTIEPGQTVHTSGPYRFVRHPAYLGDLLIVFGFVLAWGSWIAASIGMTIALAGHIPRIHVEEAALRETLGADYDRYAKNRARLVPGVW